MRTIKTSMQQTQVVMREKLLPILLALGGAGWLAGCSSPPAPSSPTVSKPVEMPAAEPAKPEQSLALTMNGYKRDVARQVYRANPQHLYEGQPPPLLKSIVVLRIRVDGKGQLSQISVLRSNGYKELEARAIQSVRDATPLPMPNRLFMQGGAAEFVETWLFRNDGRFQIRSIAEPQSSE